MFKSPLVLPLTLIFAGVLAFMATTGVLPAEMLRFWPILFVILGLVGLVSLSGDELSGQAKAARPNTARGASAKSSSSRSATAGKKNGVASTSSNATKATKATKKSTKRSSKRQK
jgi:hypothetical protein